MTQQLDPAHSSALNTLSNNNCTATHTGTNALHGLSFGIQGYTTGKFYWEGACQCVPASEYVAIGIGNTGTSTSAYLGSNTTGVGWYGAGDLYFNAGVVATWGSFASNQRLCLQMDLSSATKTLAGRVAGGSWSANYTIPAGVLAAAVVPAVDTRNIALPDMVTVYFDPVLWLYAPSAGFAPFDPYPHTLTNILGPILAQ